MSPTLRRRLLLFLLIAVLGCALDLGTKSWIFAELGPPRLEPPEKIWWLVGNNFGLQTSLNQGALFGIGHGQITLFASLSILAAIGIPVWLFVFRAAEDAWLNYALALITGGILGNLYDRLGLWWDATRHAAYPPHAVRDWILWQAAGYSWPNFNLADSFLVVGSMMILAQATFFPPQKIIDNPKVETP